MNWEHLNIGWFDFATLLTLLLGLHLGKKHGISKELPGVLQWCMIVAVGGYGYAALGGYVSQLSGFTTAFGDVIAYLLMAAVITFIFSLIKNSVRERLETKRLFGDFEYYLGMFAGAIRFSCILLLTLALLHSVSFSPAQQAKRDKVQQDNFGAVYFPTLHSIRRDVFVNSLSGRWVGETLPFLLIDAEPPAEPRKRS